MRCLYIIIMILHVSFIKMLLYFEARLTVVAGMWYLKLSC